MPIVLAEDVIDSLFSETQRGKAYQLTVDLAQQQLVLPTGERLTFDLDMFRKECLLQGLDDIALTLEKATLITAYEEQRREACPWLFADLL